LSNDTVGPFKVEVIADSSGEFCGNALRFPTLEAAKTYAVDLFCRWTAVKTWRVVEAVQAGWGTFQVVVLTKEAA
jgi:hypothetical protein